MLLSDEQIDLIVLNHAPPIHPDFQQDDDHHALCRAIEAAVLAEQAKQEPVHQWRKRGDDKWADANKEDAYARVDEHYEARTLHLHPAPAPEGMVMVPERIEKVESGFRGMFLKEAQAYKRGWNDCRASVIAAAEKEKN